MVIRKEEPADIPAIHALVRDAFGKDGEARLINDLRASGNLALSLVASAGSDIIGHIGFSPMSWEGTIGLAPLAVASAHRRQGIGQALIEAGIEEMRVRHIGAIFVLGSDKYYPRFGFLPARQFSVGCIYPGGEKYFFVRELRAGALKGKSGTVRYAPEFDKL